MKELTRRLRLNAVAIEAYADKLDADRSDQHIARQASNLEERAREITSIAQELRMITHQRRRKAD